MKYFFIFVFGFILGIIISRISYKRKTINGIINIDHQNNLCKFQIANEPLLDYKKKNAVFIINHKAVIREENTFYNE